MIYSKRFKQVLRALQFDSSQSEEQISRQLKIRSHTVRYEKQRALQAKVIRNTHVIDFFRLGLQQFQCYLSFASRRTATRRKIIETLQGSHRVAWFAELGGRLQLGMSVCATNASELHTILDAFMRVSDLKVLQRQIGVVTRFEYYPKKYLDPTNRNKELTVFDCAHESVSRDSVDSQILCSLTKYPDLSIQAIAEKSGIPRTTVQLRIARLREMQILRPPAYLINAQALGMSTYKIFIYLSHDNQEILNTLSGFAMECTAIVNLIRCHAPWEYELTAEVEAPQEIPQLLSQLSEALQPWMRDIEIVPVFSQARPPHFLTNYLSQELRSKR